MDLVHQLLCERPGAAPPAAVSSGDLYPRPLCFVLVCNSDGSSCRSVIVPSHVSQTDFCTRQSKQGWPWSPELPLPLGASPPAASLPGAAAHANPAQELAGSSLSNPPAKHSSPSPFGFMLSHNALSYILALQHTGSFQLL